MRINSKACGYRSLKASSGPAARERKPLEFLLILLVAVFVSEGAIMLLIPALPTSLQSWKEMLDAVLLTLSLAPIVYFLSVRPLTNSLREQTAMAEDLRSAAIYLDSMHEAFCAVDLEGKILCANRALHETWKLTHEELGRLTVFDLLPPEERDKQREAYEASMLRGRDIAFETACVRADGTRIPMLASASAWQDGSGGAAGWITVFTDITQRKQAEAVVEEARVAADQARVAAEEAARVKGEFLANMSHEIRTPMNAIIGLSHLLSRSRLDDRQNDQVGKIQSSAKLLLQLINDILDFSKIEAGRLDIEEVPFSVETLFTDLADMLATSAESKGLEFLLRIDRHIPMQLVGDPLRIKQVLINLTNNAIKFTSQGEVVVACTVEAESPNSKPPSLLCRFSVSDTGIGLTEDQRKRLFQAFAQADTSISRRYGGTGLGLVICQRLVQLMGGEIRLDSEPGQGTRVHFTIPLAIPPEGAIPRSSVPQDLHGKHALVIDDNGTSREILRGYLHHCGFEVVTANSGPEGLALLQQPDAQPVHVILVDQRMPDMDGLETISRLRALEDSSHKHPVIMVSAYDRESIQEKSQALQIDGYLPKPVYPSQLIDLLMEVLVHQGPADRTIVARKKPADTFTAPPDLSGYRVLLAEDNAINQMVAREILNGSGLEVVVAGNGAEALALLATDKFDLVLMDLQMPGVDGFEATRRIRAEARYDALPVIAMTAHAMSGDRERCLAAGMNDHTTKPIDPPALFQTLVRWLPSTPGRPKPKAEPMPPKATPAPAPPPTEKPPGFPESLPGLNVAEGVNRLFQDSELYRAIVLEFCEAHLEAAAEIRALLQKEDTEAAIRLAHLIRGASGNLSANDLHHAASDLETTLRDSQDREAVARSVDGFARELEVLRESQRILQALGPAAT